MLAIEIVDDTEAFTYSGEAWSSTERFEQESNIIYDEFHTIKVLAIFVEMNE